MDGWSLPTLVLFPVPRLYVISPRHHLPSLFRQKTRASISITKNLLITKGYQWWLLARCSFCPVLIIHSAHVAGNMEDSVNGLLQKMLSDWWVSKPAIFWQISYQSIANSDLDWPPSPTLHPPGHFFSHQPCPSLPHGPLTLCPPLPASPAHPMFFSTYVDHNSEDAEATSSHSQMNTQELSRLMSYNSYFQEISTE